MPKRTPKEDEKDTKRKQKRVWLNSILLDHAKEKKDSTTDKWKTLARYIEEAVEEKIKRVDERAIVHIDNKKNNNNLKTNNWRFKEEFVKGPLLAHKSLVVEFWLGKGGSKNQRSWQLLEKGCLEILGSYGPDVLEEQIKKGIDNKLKS